MNYVPRFSPGAAERWELFTSHANWDGLHPQDWERFYNFVRWTRLHCRRITSDDVRMLVESSCPLHFEDEADDPAVYLPEVFRHCRAVLGG